MNSKYTKNIGHPSIFVAQHCQIQMNFKFVTTSFMYLYSTITRCRLERDVAGLKCRCTCKYSVL
ncbi:hypothetical protein Hanom_Chr10g00930611 [Helianthus anomalus]